MSKYLQPGRGRRAPASPTLVADAMLDLVVGLALRLMFPRRRKKPFPDHDHEPPTSTVQGHARALVASYRRWAKEKELAHDEDARGYRGTIAGRAVLVRPGLDGSAPIGTEAEITIEHDETATFLVTSKRREDPSAKSDIGECLVLLFDEPALETLRSIAVIPTGVRLRFSPLTDPDTVQAAIDRAVAAVEERLRTRLRGDPYR